MSGKSESSLENLVQDKVVQEPVDVCPECALVSSRFTKHQCPECTLVSSRFTKHQKSKRIYESDGNVVETELLFLICKNSIKREKAVVRLKHRLHAG